MSNPLDRLHSTLGELETEEARGARLAERDLHDPDLWVGKARSAVEHAAEARAAAAEVVRGLPKGHPDAAAAKKALRACEHAAQLVTDLFHQVRDSARAAGWEAP